MTIYLRNEDVRRLLGYGDCVEVIDALFRHEAEGLAENFPTTALTHLKGFHRTKVGAAYGFGAYGLKTYGRVAGPGGHPVRYLVLLYDSETGLLDAIVEAKDLGEVRTAAVSAVGARYMAREDAETVGIIGTGREARGQIAALTTVRPIKRVRCWSRSEDNRRAFAEEVAERHGIEVIPAESAERAVAGADIVITVTSADEPVLSGDWLSPGTHVGAIGATSLFRRELDGTAVQRAEVVAVENLEQAQAECGELIWAAHHRLLNWKNVRELHEIVSGRARGRPKRDSITLLDTIGVGAEDIAVAAFVFKKARAEGVGVALPM